MAVPILYGLVMGGIRILPYAVRYGKDIVRIGYKVIASGKELKLAQKIFGNKNVIKNITDLGRFSTRAEKFSPIKSKQIINLGKGGTEIGKNISTVADKAANQVSRFIINSPTRTVGGTEIAAPIRSLFGQNVKFSSQTLKTIAKAETGPLALGKEVVTTKAAPKILKEFTSKKIPEVIKLKQAFEPAIKTGKEIATVATTVEKAPWYVAIMPRFLRTTKDIMKAPYERTVTPAISLGKVAAYGTAATAATMALGDLTPEKEEKDITRDLDYDQLFGTAGTEVPEDLDVPSAIQTFSD